MLGYTARQSDWADGAEIANQLPLTYGERPGSSRCTQRDRQGSEQKTEADEVRDMCRERSRPTADGFEDEGREPKHQEEEWLLEAGKRKKRNPS